MKRDELIKLLEEGARIMVSSVRIIAPDSEWQGSGVLVKKNGTFQFKIHFPLGVETPKMKIGSFREEDFWKMEGILEHTFPFQVPSVPPIVGTNCENGVHYSVRLRSKSLELQQAKLSPEEAADMQRLFKSLATPVKSAENQLPTLAAGTLGERPPCRQGPAPVLFKGILKGFKVLAQNANSKQKVENKFFGGSSRESMDTCHGRLGEEWQFGFRQQGENLEFLLVSSDDYQSAGDDDDMRKFHAFMSAVSFIYGKNAWPSQLQHKREGELLLDRISSRESASGSPHFPFPERLWFNVITGNVSCDITNVFTLAYHFFERENTLSKTVADILFYFREATRPEVHNQISIMSLCALLEQLVRAICRHEIRSAPDEVALRTIIAEYGVRVLDHLPHGTNLPVLIQTVIAKMEKPRPFAARHLFERSLRITNQSLTPQAETAFNYWKTNRNKHLHDGDHENENRDSLTIESKLAGAVLRLTLKLIGYSGIARLSTFEDDYQHV